MMRLIYKFIDDIPMYRVVLYALVGIVLTAIVLAAVGQLSFSVVDMAISLSIILVVSYGINRLFAIVFSAKTNPESSLVTGLIIFLLIFPQSDVQGWFYVAITAAIAQVSKYILAFRGRHIFNPAAVAVTISSLLGLTGAVWWVGTPVLIPVVMVLGGLVIAKVREFTEVGIYFVAIVLTAIIVNVVTGHNVAAALSAFFISGPILFAGAIMLTEPLTTPSIKSKKVWLALLVGVVTASSIPWLTKPEVALLIGNLIAFVLGQRRIIKLKLVDVQQIAPGIFELLFQPLKPIRFQAGQYIELTVPHKRADSRGVRRVFSIASSPQNSQLRITMNVPEKSSSFKKTLIKLEKGTTVTATRIGGNFILSRHQTPVVFIAGGIGITPFRSMLEDLLLRGEKRPITIFYGVRDSSLLVFKDVLQRARDELKATIVPVIDQPSISWPGETGKITPEIISRYVDVHAPAHYYISGSNAMVEATKQSLRRSIKHSTIHTDYFTGY